MAEVSESKRLWRTALIVAGVGVLVLVPLAWLALRMYDDMIQRRVIAANESAALTNLENIQAAQQLYFEAHGQYGTFRQLIDSGIFQAEVSGDPPAASGYVFTVRVQPKTDTQPAAYSVNADPVRPGGRDATGRRHFFVSSEVTGIRYNETRPANKDDKLRPKVSGY
jgi:type II secretory pathway pseudopilin PulG